MPIRSRLRAALSGLRHPHHPRRAAPSCRGGASSVLRVAPPGDRRLPTADELFGWMNQDAGVLMPVTGLHPPAPGSEFAARQWPRP